MCGIFAIIRKDDRAVDEGLLKAATQVLKHRGPDGEGYYVKNNFGLGHRRLSIIDLSSEAAQPMHKHGCTMAYNGEVYNYKEIRKELIGLGYKFFSQSDTEVIISAYQEWGPGFEKKLNGMWAFIMHDPKANNVYISRDRYGMKPLYQYETEKAIYFASEIKAFKILPEWTGDLNRELMYDYLLHGLLHHKQASIYEDVKMVASSSYSILGEGGDSISCAPYYVLELEERETDAKDLKALFQKSVERHLIADVEVASSLSGGIDSSAFACIASRFNTRIKTFSYVPTEKEFSEKDFIEEVLTSNNLGNNSISPDFEAHIAAHEEAIMANDAPALTMSLMSHYLLYANVASQNIKVLLSGQGADELLAGYGTYYLPFLRSLKKKNKAKWLVEMFSLVINYPGAIKKFISRSMDTTDYTSFVKNGIMGRTLPPGNFEEYYKYMIENGLLPALLQFEDRNAMAHGVEGRLPFLDRDFSRSCHGISPELKIKKGIRKYIFRKAMEGIVPQKILSRKDKMGYVSPQEKWMEENQEYFTGKITEGLKKHEGWVDETVVDFICQSFKDKNRKHYPFIWRLFSFYQFLEKH